MKFSMERSDNELKFSKYFRLITPNEFEIDRDDIFYRDKYNDIINYLKIMLTNHEESIVQSYAKFIQPKGTLLININSGTDITDYLKLISNNYYLDFIELNQEEIVKSPEVFFSNFISILENIIKNKERKKEIENGKIHPINEYKTEEKKIKRLLVINQHNFSKSLLKEKNLLELFIVSFKEKKSLIKEGVILIWINNKFQEIEVNSRLIFEAFDLFIKIPLLDKIERETILRNFLEKNPKIVFDIKTLVEYTSNWEVNDLNRLLRVGIFKHFLNSELNESSNEVTDVLINLIESGEYLPSLPETTTEREVLYGGINNRQNLINKISTKDRNEIANTNDIKNFITQIKEERISDFMLSQLYESAASKNYSELLLIIDKLNKQEPLEENDRKILAKYSFVLNDSPKMAQINLEKAKKRIDNLKRAFGKR